MKLLTKFVVTAINRKAKRGSVLSIATGWRGVRTYCYNVQVVKEHTP
jgi:hypothetical protein